MRQPRRNHAEPEGSMPGPAPRPIALRILRGNPGKRPLRRGFEPEPEPSVPDAPVFLTGYAMDEWYRVAGGLHLLGLLTPLDHMPLAAYCAAYARWRAAEEALAEMAKRDPVTGALLIKTVDGNPRSNPLARI